MKCSECRKQIPAARLRALPNVRTCSTACSGIRQGEKGKQRWSAYYRRGREALAEVAHEPLVPGTEPVVRKGHVVGWKKRRKKWTLALVIRATHKGRATHVCAPGEWNQKVEKKPRAEDRLSPDMKIAVLPPEWAQDQELAVRAEEAGMEFRDWEDLQAALAAESQGGKAR